MPHTVIKSRHTNVKNHSEISRYFLVHVLPCPLRNFEELAKFYHFKLAIIIMARIIVNCFIMHVALPEMLVGHFRQHSSVTAIGLMEKEITIIGTPSYAFSHSQQTHTFHVIILHKLPKHD